MRLRIVAGRKASGYTTRYCSQTHLFPKGKVNGFFYRILNFVLKPVFFERSSNILPHRRWQFVKIVIAMNIIDLVYGL